MTLAPSLEAPRILSGDEAREHMQGSPKQWLTMMRLARQLALSTHDDAGISCERLRSVLRLALHKILPGSDINEIHPYPNDEELTLQILQDLHKRLLKKQLLATVVGNDLAGVGGYAEVKKDAATRIVEIRRIVIDTVHRGRGFATQLVDAILAQLEQKIPHATPVLATRAPSILHWCERNNFKDIDWQTFWLDWKQAKLTKTERQWLNKRVQDGGWQYRYRPPSANRDAQCVALHDQTMKT